MDFRLFFKNKFLKQNFGDVAQNLDNSNYSTFKNTLKENRSWYVPASIFNSYDNVIQQLFNSIDGTSIHTDSNGNLINDYNGQKDSKLQEQELIDWVKYNYKKFKGSEISDEDLKKMKMSDFMSYVEDFLNNGFKLE